MCLSRTPSGLLVVVAGFACSEVDTPNPTPTPASIAINAGNMQVGPAGQALATQLSVIVRDASNSPLQDVSVTWAAASGGGSVNPTTSSTNASGIASTTRTLGTNAGANTTTAQAAGLSGSVTFNAVAQIQGAVTIGSRFQSPLIDTVLATTVAQPLIAVVMNQSGGPVPGIIVTWSASGGGTVSQLVDTTDAGGESQVDYTFGAIAGVYGAQAVVNGLIGSPVSYTLTAGAGNPALLVKTGGDNLTLAPGSQVIHTVTTRDAHGNARNGVTIDWAVAGGGGTISPAQNITGGDGTATALRTLSAGLGAHTATATAAGLGGSPATFTTTAANVTNVTVGGATNVFSPANVTIAQNGTVVWTWAAGNTLFHNVTFAGGTPTPITDRTSGSEGRTFTATGTFNYQCTNHPATMNGSVTVTP